MPDDRVRPFSNGSQYADWQASNCDSCTKSANPDADCPITSCEIESALAFAYLGDGRIPLLIAERMGFGGKNEGRYVWPCPEHDPPFVNVPKET